ncbi:MAG: zinc-dependent alcohol dehydrogenase family protein [Spirochaetia bacterium]
MKAMVVENWGGPEAFELKDIPKPEAGPGQVVIRVVATSVNPVDYKIRLGKVGFGPDLPAVLHSDVAGVVDEVGEGVTHLVPGDEVYAFAGGFKGWEGALAEYMLTDARVVAKKSSALSFREAAAVPLVALTAWFALVDRARISPLDHVLVHAGAGGVGHVGVQIAAAMGARVATTVSTREKAEIARRLGAEEIILYPDEGVDSYVNRLTAGRGFDIVFDTVGGENVASSMRAVRESGQVLGIALRTSGSFAPIHEKNLTFSGVLMVLPLIHREQLDHYRVVLETLARWSDEGRFRPVLAERRFTLEEVGQAHALLEAGGITGKVVVDVAEA